MTAVVVEKTDVLDTTVADDVTRTGEVETAHTGVTVDVTRVHAATGVNVGTVEADEADAGRMEGPGSTDTAVNVSTN